jgi:hypothetical protein
MYQLPYFAITVAGLVLMRSGNRRVILLGAMMPFVLLCALYLKNEVLFGVPATSSWGGMSLAKLTIKYLSRDTVQSLVTSGALSPISLVEPFSAPNAYPAEYFTTEGFDSVQAISAPWKSTGVENLNHIGYIRISGQYLKDSLYVLRRYPSRFARASRDAWRIYGWSSSQDRQLLAHRNSLAAWNRLFDIVVYGRRPDGRLFVGLLIALSLAIVFGAIAALSPDVPPQSRLFLAYALFNIVWLAVMGNTIEMGENNRFRFATDPLTIVLLTLLMQTTSDRFRRSTEHES